MNHNLKRKNGKCAAQVAVAEMTLTDGYRLAVAMTRATAVIDAIACHTASVPQKQLLILHGGNNGTWTTDAEWAKNHPDTHFQDQPCGFMCDHCHEPVMYYLSLKSPDEIEHIRQLCGCTMLLMAPETLPWWSELNGKKAWDGIIVAGARQAHKQHGVN